MSGGVRRLEKDTPSGDVVFWECNVQGYKTFASGGKIGGRKAHYAPIQHPSKSAALKYLNREIMFKIKKGFHEVDIAPGDSATLNHYDDDTDSVASSLSSVVPPYRGGVTASGMAQRPTGGVSPLNRRRSLRIQAMNACMAPMKGQNTVVMQSVPTQPQLQHMVTVHKWAKFRETSSGDMNKQPTINKPALKRKGTPRPGRTKKWANWREDGSDSSEDERAPVPSTSRAVPSLKTQDTVDAKLALLRKQSTTFGLRNMLAHTQLNSVSDDKQDAAIATGNGGVRGLKRKATTASILSPTLSKPGSKPKVKRRVTVVAPGEQMARKRAPSDDTAHRHKRQKIGMLKRQSTIANQGPLYIPPLAQWPIDMTGQAVWALPVNREDGSARHCLGLYVDPEKCLIGDEDGGVIELDATVSPCRRLSLPSGVKCLLLDSDFLYAGCNNGGLYDITHQDPRLIWATKQFGPILTLAMHEGKVAVSDQNGYVAVVQYDGYIWWKKKSSGEFGWMACIDDTGVYHGHSQGVTKYSALDGTVMWNKSLQNGVLHGVKKGDALYVATGSSVVKIDTFSGDTLQVYSKGSSRLGSVHCCDVGSGVVFVCGKKLLCYDESSGEIVYSVTYPDGSLVAGRCQYFQGRLFCVGQGGLIVLDFTEETVKATQNGGTLETVLVNPSTPLSTVTPLKKVKTTSKQAQSGVVVECSKPRTGKLKVKATSVGYNKAIEVLLPCDLKKKGSKYIVDSLSPTADGSYYRVCGDIKELK